MIFMVKAPFTLSNHFKLRSPYLHFISIGVGQFSACSSMPRADKVLFLFRMSDSEPSGVFKKNVVLLLKQPRTSFLER